MDWVEKELRVTGACAGAGVVLPWALEGSMSWLALLVFPAFCGAMVGLLVGVVAVGGGRYALWSNPSVARTITPHLATPIRRMHGSCRHAGDRTCLVLVGRRGR